jgi:hypothetical protein
VKGTDLDARNRSKTEDMQVKKKPDTADLDTNAHHWILGGTPLK